MTLLVISYVLLIIITVLCTMYFLKRSRDSKQISVDEYKELFVESIKESYNTVLNNKFNQWRTGSKIDQNAEWKQEIKGK